MRREVLYQYDLPIEILNDLPYDEEVLNVLFARSKDKLPIPLLITRNRIFWGYPETDSVYKVFELQYVDLVSICVKFQATGSATLTIKTDLGKDIVFPHIQESADLVRDAMISAAYCIREKSFRVFSILHQKNLLTEEYVLRENPNASGLSSDDDIFEDEFVGQSVIEEEDEFFEVTESSAAEEHTSAVVDRVARMVQATEPAFDDSDSVTENDAVIYDDVTSHRDEQWLGESGGDAEILPRGRPWKNMPRASVPAREVFSAADDDSEVYGVSARPRLAVPKPKAVHISEPAAGVVEQVEVLPNPAVKPRGVEGEDAEIEPVMIHRRGSSAAEAVTLYPREGIDDMTVDKSLEALRFLRDNKIISEAEYKKRSLSLFEKEGDN